MSASTWSWTGGTSNPFTYSNWRLTSGPGNDFGVPMSGDTVFISSVGVPPVFDDASLDDLNWSRCR
jgi:hypothetical protein